MRSERNSYALNNRDTPPVILIETDWGLKVVPDTTAGWTITNCSAPITITITEY